MVPNDTERLQVAQVIQAMAAEVGFDLKIRATEFATSLDLAEKGDFSAYLLAWSGRTDPDGNLYNFVGCKGGLNYGRYCVPEVESEIIAGRQVLAPEQRMTHYQKVAEAVLKDRPIVYLFHRRWLYGYTAKLDGFQPYPDGLIRLTDLRMK
jgi:peptide/nickel transport system substrate-binding protein